MKNKTFIVFIFFLGVTVFYFYRFFMYSQIPFPGDLLVSEYAPWKYESYLGFTPGSIPHKAQYFDVARQLYPWKTFVVDSLKNGQLPLWNPYNFSGSPLLANIQSAAFYPLSGIFFIFEQPVAWAFFILLQPFLAAFFTYLYCRKIGISLWGSTLAGVSFGFSLFMSVFLEYGNIGHVILWLPFTLYALERLLSRASLINILLLALGTCLFWFAGHLQLAGLSVAFTGIYSLFRTLHTENKREMSLQKKLLPIAVMFLGTTAASLQLFPTFELITHAARVAQEQEYLTGKLLIQPFEISRILSPDIFGNPATRNYTLSDPYPGKALYAGLIPFCLALLGIFSFRKNKYILFFSVAWLVMFLGILRTPASELFYSFHLPLISSSSPGNSIFLLSFCVAVLSGFGIDAWMRDKERKSYLAALLCIFFIAVIPLLVWEQDIVLRNIFYTTALFSGYLTVFLFGKKFIKYKEILVAIFILVTVLDLFYFFQKFNPFVDKALIFPKAEVFDRVTDNTTDRFWGYGSGYIEANLATQYQLFAAEGYDPLYPRRYGAFLHASNDGKLLQNFNNQTRSDAVIAKGYGAQDIRQNTARLRVLDTLGVRYILTRSDDPLENNSFPAGRYSISYEDNGWRIFRNTLSAQRVFLAEEYKIFVSDEDFQKQFFSNGFNPQRTVLLEEAPDGVSAKGTGGIAKIISYSPNLVEIRTEASGSSVLVLSDTDYPGWSAQVDGKEVPIFRANYSFRSVVVPEGKHLVRFAYEPQSFFIGLKTSIISMVALMVLGIFVRKRAQYEK